ncbi:Yop protein translocation protein L [compost metagenome]
MFAFTRLNPEQITLKAEQVLLRSDDYQQPVTADELLVCAQQQVLALETQAQEAYEQQARLGWQAGMEQAYAEQALLIQETVLRCQRFYQQVEEQMSAVVLQATRKLIEDYPASEMVLLATREGLALLGETTRVTLHVHPHVMSAVREGLARMVEEGARLTHIDVVADPQAQPGSCILESDIGRVDASVDTQLNALEAALKQSHQSDQQLGLQESDWG